MSASVGVNHTRRFVEVHREPCRLLEVGCGDGELAATLVARGFEVVGIDIDPECVRAARERGVEARRDDILELDDGPFGAVLFSRCLHHIHHPKMALQRALRALGPCGSILIEDFGHDLVDLAGARWRYATSERVGEERDALEAWALDHPTHHLKTSAELLAAVASVLPGARHFRVPYLYRYRLEHLTPGDAVDEAFLDREQEQIDAGCMAAVGLRWVYRHEVDVRIDESRE